MLPGIRDGSQNAATCTKHLGPQTVSEFSRENNMVLVSTNVLEAKPFIRKSPPTQITFFPGRLVFPDVVQPITKGVYVAAFVVRSEADGP